MQRYGGQMKAITIRQPYDYFVAWGRKPVENRNGASIAGQARKHIGEVVAIHSSQWWRKFEVARTMRDLLSAGVVTREEFEDHVNGNPKSRGCVVGSAIIDRVIKHGDGDPLNKDEWRTMDRFGIVLRDPVSFTSPIPMLGKLGLWTVPEMLVPAIMERRERESGWMR